MAEELVHLSHEELRAQVHKMKLDYDNMRKYALQMEQKSQRSVTREKRIIVDHQKQVLQAETLNMMTKYQLVFAKIECQVNRVLNSNKIREMNYQQKAFNKMKQNAQASHMRENYLTHFIHLRMQSNLGVKMLARFETQRLASLRKAFENWRLSSDAAKVIERLQSAIEKELAKKQTHNQKLIQALQLKQEDLQRELAKQQELADRQEEVRQRIEAAEAKLAQAQYNARSRLSERSQENGAQQDLSEMELLREKEQLHEQLLAENKKLKSNLTACETNLSGFISEMNALLDQHEMGSLLGQALMPQDPNLVAMAGNGRGGQSRGTVGNQAPQPQMNQEQNSQDEQLYSSQHDSINDRPIQRNHLGETGGGP